MLLIQDIRESRLYQEAMKEGAAIMRLAAEKKSVAEIATILGIDAELVRKVLTPVDPDKP